MYLLLSFPLLAGYFLYLSYCLFFSILLVKFPVLKMISQYLWWPQIVTMKQNARTCFSFSFFFLLQDKEQEVSNCQAIMSFGGGQILWSSFLSFHYIVMASFLCSTTTTVSCCPRQRPWRTKKLEEWREWREWIKLAGNIQTHSEQIVVLAFSTLVSNTSHSLLNNLYHLPLIRRVLYLFDMTAKTLYWKEFFFSIRKSIDYYSIITAKKKNNILQQLNYP